MKNHIYIETDTFVGYFPKLLLKKEYEEYGKMFIEAVGEILEHKLNNDYLYLEDRFGLNNNDLKKFLEITSIDFPSDGFMLKDEEIKTFEQSEFRWKIQ